ncbi:Arm DNA-binding domain-containing protein [Xanthobacter autotrophicus DSM 431]|uniref:Arm DNA-binding domain-containing protein n=1 Tax=Xanthobacter nonsaccharivorans TaxID=3119912 RepID=UPI003726397B
MTGTALRAAKAGDKLYKLADGGGLCLLVNPTGSRLWRLKFRIEGKEKLLPSGPIPRSRSPRRGSGAMMPRRRSSMARPPRPSNRL